MIMVFTRHNVFIAGLTIMQQDFARKSRLGKQLEGSIHGCLTDTLIARLYFQVQFLDADMLVGGEKDIKNDVALAGGAETFGERK
jgi:hypothetical protein